VGVGQDFFALGGSWHQAMEARARLDKEQSIGLTPRDFLEAPTLEGLAGRYKNPDDEVPIVVTLQRGDPNKPPLLCLLGIQLYVDLALAMNDGTPVVGMHVPITYVPGRTARPSLSEIASRYLEVVRSVRPSGPYYLAGLCFGGVVAYEVARLLRQQGEEVSLVVIFDAVLPRGRHVDSLDRLASGVRRSLREPRRTLRRMLQKTAATDGRPASRLATGKKLVERLLSEATVEGPANSGDLIVTGPAAEADVARLQASNPYLDAPLLTFRAARDGAPTWQTTLPDMGWSGFARSVQACAVESDHLGIVRPPHAKQIAAIIMREIGRT